MPNWQNTVIDLLPNKQNIFVYDSNGKSGKSTFCLNLLNVRDKVMYVPDNYSISIGYLKLYFRWHDVNLILIEVWRNFDYSVIEYLKDRGVQMIILGNLSIERFSGWEIVLV